MSDSRHPTPAPPALCPSCHTTAMPEDVAELFIASLLSLFGILFVCTKCLRQPDSHRHIPVVPHTGEAQECSICLETVDSGTCVRQLPCEHRYHLECLDTWLKTSVICPLCRISLAPQPPV